MKILNVFLISIFLSTPCVAESVTFGSTYNIVEPDTLDEIKSRAAKVDWEKVYSKDPSTWKALQSPILPDASENQKREHLPIYVLEQKVIDRNGNTIYPKGYKFNPLEYMLMPSRIIVIGRTKKHVDWLKTQNFRNDMIITSGGDPIAIGKALGRSVFLINDQLIERLDLEVVPTVLEQSGNKLILTEYAINEKTTSEN